VNSAIRCPSDRYPIIRTALSERRPKQRTALTHKHLDLKELIEIYQSANRDRTRNDNTEKVESLTAEVQELKALNEVLAAQATLAALTYRPSPSLTSVPPP
jgi:hypothetical protein